MQRAPSEVPPLSNESPIVADLPSAPRSGGRFRNLTAMAPGMPKPGLKVMWDFFFNKPADTQPRAALSTVPITRAELDSAPERSLYRLGHSSLLFKLRGGWWVTDPVFCERASPFQQFGPKRFHAPPLRVEELPPLRGVLLTHDHYDHLDFSTIRALAPRAEHFIAPLGVGDRAIGWGVPRAKVRQLDWWHSTEVDGLRFTSTPAQHFSGRGFGDRDRTLWASWVLEDDSFRIYLSGDSGYFSGFAEIGRRFGPFDLTLIEAGAYNEHWRYVHMLPQESVQAHVDVRGAWMLPIHNGTFDLAFHPWQEPLELVCREATARGVRIATPRIGERFQMNAPQECDRWWR